MDHDRIIVAAVFPSAGIHHHGIAGRDFQQDFLCLRRVEMGLEPSLGGYRPNCASDQFGSVLTIDATAGSRRRARVSAPIVCERISRV
jgi:hypothetical protein